MTLLYQGLVSLNPPVWENKKWQKAYIPIIPGIAVKYSLDLNPIGPIGCWQALESVRLKWGWTLRLKIERMLHRTVSSDALVFFSSWCHACGISLFVWRGKSSRETIVYTVVAYIRTRVWPIRYAGWNKNRKRSTQLVEKSWKRGR